MLDCPSTQKDLHNLCHTLLRNFVEQLFGSFKRKFLILKSAPKIELNKQVCLVYALCVLWNFCRKYKTIESLMEGAESNLTEATGDNFETTQNKPISARMT